MGPDGAQWIMRARSARWFAWRLALMVTDPSSRFHAVIDKRRKDEAGEQAPLVAAAPGEDDY